MMYDISCVHICSASPLLCAVLCTYVYIYIHTLVMSLLHLCCVQCYYMPVIWCAQCVQADTYVDVRHCLGV